MPVASSSFGQDNGQARAIVGTRSCARLMPAHFNPRQNKIGLGGLWDACAGIMHRYCCLLLIYDIATIIFIANSGNMSSFHWKNINPIINFCFCHLWRHHYPPLSSEEAIEIELSDWLINQNDVICKQNKDPIVTKSALAYSFMNYFFIKF